MHAHLLHPIRTQGRTLAEPARQTGLGRPSVSSVVAELSASSLVTGMGLRQNVGGRAAALAAAGPLLKGGD